MVGAQKRQLLRPDHKRARAKRALDTRKNARMTSVRICGVFAALSLCLFGCVSPEVVQTRTVDDNNLTCEEIKVQLDQLAQIREEAAKGQRASGENVAAAILFWPAVIGNYQNAKQALEAANERNDVLVALAEKKRCRF